MTLRRLELLFNLLDSRIEIIHKILLLGVLRLSLGLLLELLVCIFNLRIQFSDLLLILLNDFLAEV